jgi:hypothetical protein
VIYSDIAFSSSSESSSSEWQQMGQVRPTRLTQVCKLTANSCGAGIWQAITNTGFASGSVFDGIDVYRGLVTFTHIRHE